LGDTTNIFTSQTFLLNPANSNLFPWLSTQATAFSQFRFNKLRFIVRSIVGTSSNGTIDIASTPDVVDATPTSKAALLQYENASRGNLWSTTTHTVPPDILNRLPYYLTSQSTTSTDTTREMGKLFIGALGDSADQVYGELYVDYSVSMMHPQVPSAAVAKFYGSDNNYNSGTAIVYPSMQSNIVSVGSINCSNVSYNGTVVTNQIRVQQGGKCIKIIFTMIVNVQTTTVNFSDWNFTNTMPILTDYYQNDLTSHIVLDNSTENLVNVTVSKNYDANKSNSHAKFEISLIAIDMPSPYFFSWANYSVVVVSTSNFVPTLTLSSSPFLDTYNGFTLTSKTSNKPNSTGVNDSFFIV